MPRAKQLAAPKPQSVRELLSAAEEARQIREYQTNPDVVALDVERSARLITRTLLLGLGLGFAFTSTNVQAFVAGGAHPDQITWWAAWLMEPMLVLVVVSLLRAQAVMSRHGVSSGPWLKGTLFMAGLFTYLMNTWESWSALDRTGIVLHSIAPIVVICAAEVLTELRERLAAAARAAAQANHATRQPAHQAALSRSGQAATAADTPGSEADPAITAQATSAGTPARDQTPVGDSGGRPPGRQEHGAARPVAAAGNRDNRPGKKPGVEDGTRPGQDVEALLPVAHEAASALALRGLGLNKRNLLRQMRTKVRLSNEIGGVLLELVKASRDGHDHDVRAQAAGNSAPAAPPVPPGGWSVVPQRPETGGQHHPESAEMVQTGKTPHSRPEQLVAAAGAGEPT
jgi:hypothetical protein